MTIKKIEMTAKESLYSDNFPESGIYNVKFTCSEGSCYVYVKTESGVRCVDELRSFDITLNLCKDISETIDLMEQTLAKAEEITDYNNKVLTLAMNAIKSILIKE